jgi:hypothetical protein
MGDFRAFMTFRAVPRTSENWSDANFSFWRSPDLVRWLELIGEGDAANGRGG